MKQNFKISIKTLQEIQKWADGSKDGFIYVTFGSMILIETFPKNIIDAFYTAFRNSAPVRFLIKIKDEKKLPPGLPKNVKLFSWLPQIQVLSMFTYNFRT